MGDEVGEATRCAKFGDIAQQHIDIWRCVAASFFFNFCCFWCVTRYVAVNIILYKLQFFYIYQSILAVYSNGIIVEYLLSVGEFFSVSTTLTGALNNITTTSIQTWDYVYRSTMVRLVIFCIMTVYLRFWVSSISFFSSFLSLPYFFLSFLLFHQPFPFLFSFFSFPSPPFRCFLLSRYAKLPPNVAMSLGCSPDRNYLPRSPLPNSVTACLLTSCWRIRCRPFGVNWYIICSSNPTQMLYCNCCATVLLWHSQWS